MKKIIITIFLLILFNNIFGLSLEDLDIQPELYSDAFVKINIKRIHIYSSFGNSEKVREIVNILIDFNPENKNFYNYLLKESDKSQPEKKHNLNNNGIVKIYNEETIKKILLSAEKETDTLKKIRLYKSVLVHQPENQFIKIEIGKCYIELKKYFTAKKWFLEADAENSSQYIEKIDYLLNKSVRIIEVSGNVKKDSEWNGVNEIQIEKLIADGRKDEAIKALVKLSRKEPANYRYLYSIAKIYSDNNEYKKSLEYIDKVIILNSEFYEGLYLKGELLSKIGNFSEALATFKKIVKIAPDNSKYSRLANNMIKLLSSTY